MMNPRACTGDTLWQVFEMCTAQVCIDTRDDFRGAAPAGRFDKGPLVVPPVWCNRIQPGTVARHAPGPEADPAVALDRRLRRPHPRAAFPAARPGGMVPQPPPDPFPLDGQPLAEPGKKGGRDVAHRSALDNPAQDRVGVRVQPPVAGHGVGRHRARGAPRLHQM